MVVSCHQPNFFPWEPLLDKIRASDRFVVLTQAQFCRRQYHSRFTLNNEWHTMAVNAGRAPLSEKLYCTAESDWARIKRKLPGYAAALARFDDVIGESLIDTNVAVIRRLCEMLQIRTEIVFDYPTDLRATDRLVDLCKHYGATTYLSGPSGPKYMDVSAFGSAGICVDVQSHSGGRAAIEMVQA